MKKNETTPKGGNTFLVNMIVSNLKSPCKIKSQNREVSRMVSQCRIGILAVLGKLVLPCVVTLNELSTLIDEPLGKTQAGLYSLKRNQLVDYVYFSGVGYVVTSVIKTDAQVSGCPYGFPSCEMCVFKSAACKGNMVMKGTEDA